MNTLSAIIAAGAIATSASAQPIRFAVIGDYGVDNANQAAVANQLRNFNPQFITTTGDNTYFSGSFANWDRTQGKYYAPYIKLPAGSAYSSQGAATNNFFPVMGNHDFDAGSSSFTNYFDLPGNERYYSFTRGSVQFFMLSSDSREPDSNAVGGTQHTWFLNQVAQSTARFKVVQFHHPAQTSASTHSPAQWMRNWNFQNLGIDAVLSGHNHFMERIEIPGQSMKWFVNGAGGNSLYSVAPQNRDPNSKFLNTSTNGFMIVDADDNQITFRFIDRNGNTLDTSVIPTPGSAAFLTAAGILIGGRRRR